ncbi:transcription factor MYB27-like [Cynara cardunculus var. scolymus]|uniref:transcription factor MYB27-like n=1 Tax=Cynara cardunculus var. scolymus TaxID=59895 RepID=UPI000D626BE3|nr:transcription factor MYB27-like [Cynara cardunculus var. scolymus]
MANRDVGNLRRGPWLDEEDERLTTIVKALGDKNWDALANESGLRRSGKSCRLRWMNYLRPNLKHGEITYEEEHIILNLHKQWGNKWSRIAKRLPGRTDNEIKNYWRSHLKKKTEAQQGTRNVAEQDLSTPKCHRSPEYIIGENERDGVFGTSSTEAPEISSNMSAFGCSSPYERQITDWMSSCCWLLHDDNQLQTYEIKQHEDYMGMYPCFCQPESKPEEDMMHNVCDLWSPIWEMG